MIDLHSHVLPGIDDGARDMDDALAMARQAAADGIETICATPHIRQDHDVRIHELDDRVGALQAAVDAASIPVRIVRGGEVAETIVHTLSRAELETVAIGGRWVLLEPRAGALGPSLTAAMNRLHGRGFRVIVAHPERHGSPDLEERLAELVDDGALVQATADALAGGGDGNAWLTRLAHDGLIHVLGSDAHSSHAGRPLELAAAFAALEAAGADAERMRAAARAIVAGTDPD